MECDVSERAAARVVAVWPQQRVRLWQPSPAPSPPPQAVSRLPVTRQRDLVSRAVRGPGAFAPSLVGRATTLSLPLERAAEVERSAWRGCPWTRGVRSRSVEEPDAPAPCEVRPQ